MKLIKSLFSSIMLISLIIGFSFLFTANFQTYVPHESLTTNRIQEAIRYLREDLDNPMFKYADHLDLIQGIDTIQQEVNVPLTNSTDEYNQRTWITLTQHDAAQYDVTFNQTQTFTLAIDHLIPEASLLNYVFAVRFNGLIPFDEAARLEIPLLWSDTTKVFETDRYGDEVLPLLSFQTGWIHLPLFDNRYASVDPLLFVLPAGSHTIELINLTSQPISISNLTLKPRLQRPTYEEYKNQIPGNLGPESYELNVTEYHQKNTSYIHLTSLRDPILKPFDSVYKKLNVINGASWKESGQEVSFEIEITQSGFYQLGFNFLNSKPDMNVFRSIKINQHIPFKELEAYAFPPTSSTGWVYELLKDSNQVPYEIYLNEGINTITIRAEKEPLTKALYTMQLLADHINQFSLSIRKITGRTIDRNRTWLLTQFLPETEEVLISYDVLLKSLVHDIAPHSPRGAYASPLANVQKSIVKLQEMLKKPDDLPLYLDDLSGATNSVALYLGDMLLSLDDQPLFLDRIFIQGQARIQTPQAPFWDYIFSDVISFFASFFSTKYQLINEPDTIEVWVNRPITYVDMMQKMVDRTFTNQTGIPVKISVMQDANKLIMASAANQQPDVALGLLSYMPFDLAIRGAAYDLTQFSDFWEVANQFSPGALVPYILNERAYALPETLDFNVLVYRTDIFNSLNLMVPDTWYDVIDILPELQRYGMNFYHPIAGGGALKWFYQTSSLMLQFGGELYNENGLTTAIDSEASVRGLTFLNQLFTNYSLPEQVGSFYNQFRYGTLPVGIADFTTYLLLKNAAPEIVGKWALAPYPGIDNNGEISRYYIANGTGGIIGGNTSYPTESWTFLKWWMSESVQAEFAFDLQATYGTTYTWLSANLAAVNQSPLESADKEVILNQVAWLRDVPRTPGQYMLERSISDIWNKAVFDGVPTGVAVDQLTLMINREIRRKMIEFGFLDVNGQVLKPYIIRDIDWIMNQMETHL